MNSRYDDALALAERCLMKGNGNGLCSLLCIDVMPTARMHVRTVMSWTEQECAEANTWCEREPGRKVKLPAPPHVAVFIQRAARDYARGDAA